MTQPYDYWHIQGSSSLTIPLQSGEWSSPAQSSRVPAWNMINARPFFVGDNGVKVSRFRLMTANTDSRISGTVRFGIYNCPPPSEHNLYPSNLIAETGPVNLVSNPGYYIFKSLESPVDLSPGLYYLATLAEHVQPGMVGAWQIHGQSHVGLQNFPLGYSTVSGVGFIGFSAYHGTGTLPQEFPAIPSGSFGVLQQGAAFSAPRNSIYIEATSNNSNITVQWIYSAAHPGTASLTTDTPSSIRVTFGPNGLGAGLGTSVQQVADTFSSSSNIAIAIPAGTHIAEPNMYQVSSDLYTLHPGGPLQVATANVGAHFPATAIEISE